MNGQGLSMRSELPDDMYEMMYEPPQCCGFWWKILALLGLKTYSQQGRIGVVITMIFGFAAIAISIAMCFVFIDHTYLYKAFTYFLAVVVILLAFVGEQFLQFRVMSSGMSTLSPGIAAGVVGGMFGIVLLAFLVFASDQGWVDVSQHDLIWLGVGAFSCLSACLVAALFSRLSNAYQEGIEKQQTNEFGRKVEQYAKLVSVIMVAVVLVVGLVTLSSKVTGGMQAQFYAIFMVCNLALLVFLAFQYVIIKKTVNGIGPSGGAGIAPSVE